MLTVILTLIILLAIAGIIVIYYNDLVFKKNQVDNAFATLDAILKKRCDLIPNLVSIAQNYMRFEQTTLTGIANLRSRAMSGQLTANTRGEIENQISRTLGNLLVSVEAYPDLKTNDNFIRLQESLNEIEEQISAARRFYNTSVTVYNNALEMFPTRYMAAAMNYRFKRLFEATEQERRNVDIRSLFNP